MSSKNPIRKLLHERPSQKDAPVPFVRIAAPMVRYSKLPFRLLCREYGTDICYTPMIYALDFMRSGASRLAEYSTNSEDHPVVVQFAAREGPELARAAEAIAPHCDGIDLNCGCPQYDVRSRGCGSKLIEKPGLLVDMLKCTRNVLDPSTHDVTFSTKIRLKRGNKPDRLRQSVELARQLENTGIDFLTVHGRDYYQRSRDPCDVESVKAIADALTIPVVHNGEVFSLNDAKKLAASTGVAGIMSARALLQNPAIFAGYSHTPVEVLHRFLYHCISLGFPFKLIRGHLLFMLPNKADKLLVSEIETLPGLLQYFEDRGMPFVMEDVRASLDNTEHVVESL